MADPGPAPGPLAWWVVPGLLVAGAYPGHPAREIAERQLGALLQSGVRCVVDLMEEGPRGAPDYGPMLDELAGERGVSVERLHLPIEDHDVPGDDALGALEERIDAHLVRGDGVYVHCFGGRGRTGVVAGVALVRLGLATPGGFEGEIRERRQRLGYGGRSPETDEQAAFVSRYVAEHPRRWRYHPGNPSRSPQ